MTTRQRYLVAAILMNCFFSLAISSTTIAQDLVPGRDYIQGQIIVIFAESRMPETSQISLVDAQFGISDLDSLIHEYQGRKIRTLAVLNPAAAPFGGGIIDRAFLLEYDSEVDAQTVVGQLSGLPYFELVRLNNVIEKEFYGVKRFAISDTTEFARQWYFDDDTKDQSDLDMPEAWIIERGDSNLVIVINDSGTMVDFRYSPWILHGDFRHHWNPNEDEPPTEKLTWADINFSDGDDSDKEFDNVIGYNFAPGYASEPDSVILQRWHSVPSDLMLVDKDPVNPEEYTSWRCFGYNSHGTRVASIAAAMLGGEDVVGAAHNCQVYWVRAGLQADLNNIWDEAEGIRHSALHGDVINMSWGLKTTGDSPGEPLDGAIVFAADTMDCVLIAAVGNKKYVTDPHYPIGYPALYDKVLAVGAIARDSLTLSWYSLWMPDKEAVDVVAPVDSVNTAESDGIWADNHTPLTGCPSIQECPCGQSEKTWYTNRGTSFAAPQAAGLAALIRSRFPKLDQEQVRVRIKRSAEWYWSDPADPDYQTDRKKYGAGKINAYRALTEWDTLKVDTTWDVSDTRDGAYYVSGDLIIAENAVLTINKGVTVKIAPDHEEKGADTTRVQIVVKGTLRVGLDGSDQVVFESFTDSAPTTSDWVGIRFDSTSENNLLDGVTIKNAQIGIQNFAPVTLKNSYIANCIDGIESHATLTVDSTVIDSISSYGLEVVAGHAVLDSVAISNCSMGIVLGGDSTSMNDSTSVTCTDVSISDPDFHGLGTSTWSRRYAKLTATRIENAVYGVSLLTGSDADIDSCTIVNNSTGVLLLDCEDAKITKAVIDSNSTNGVYCMTGTNDYEIEANYIRENVAGVFCYNSDPVIKNGNTISSNTTGIKCNSGSDAVIEWNTISSNEVGVHALGASNPDLGHETGGNSIGYNTITSNDSFHVVNDTDSITIKAEKNWWGAAAGPDTTKVSDTVDWRPPLTSDPGSPPSPSPPAGGKDEGNEEIARLPSRFDLAPGYPNPFNPVTTMKYQVPKTGGLVQIIVYNVKGQVVKTILDQEKAPGFYTLTWDGRSDRGEPVASGVYFVMMTATGFKETKKLVLIK